MQVSTNTHTPRCGIFFVLTLLRSNSVVALTDSVEYEAHSIILPALARTVSLPGMTTTTGQLTRHPTDDMACSEPQGSRLPLEMDLWAKVVCVLRTKVNPLSLCLTVTIFILLHTFILVSS